MNIQSELPLVFEFLGRQRVEVKASKSPLSSDAEGVAPSRSKPVPGVALFSPPLARAMTPVTFAAVPVVF